MIELFRQTAPETAPPDRLTLRQFVTAQVAFLLVSPVVLQVLDLFTVETYFVVAYVGFLLLSEVLVPRTREADWWWWVQWIKIAGLLVFAYLVSRHVAAVVQ